MKELRCAHASTLKKNKNKKTQIRAGCLEAVLGLAIYAKQHADVWDAAAALLREHPNELSAHRQQSLLENLLAAASQMSAADK